MTEIRHVVFATDAGWRVVTDAGGEPARGSNGDSHVGGEGRFERKREAVAYAKNLVRELGGGEVRLHSPSGRILEIETVTPEASAAPAH